MKISFDKAIVWLIPYLYLVSVMYYWSYWGTFHIDALNYYPVSDLVKGVTAPLSITLFTCLVLFFLGLVLFSLHRWIMKLGIVGTILMSIALICFFVFLIYLYKVRLASYPPSTLQVTKEYQSMHLWASFACVFVASFIEVFYFRAFTRRGIFINPFRISLLICALITPSLSYAKGKANSWLIINNKNFDYVIKENLTKSRIPIYKYLGKAGEHHILSTLDNAKRIVISYDELKPLIIENYFVDDKQSVQRFRFHLKQISASKQKH
jgi:hypothetical protein